MEPESVTLDIETLKVRKRLITCVIIESLMAMNVSFAAGNSRGAAGREFSATGARQLYLILMFNQPRAA